MKFESFLTLITLFFIARPITILLHELGHALPLFFMTHEEITIYAGSYNDPQNNIKLKIGRLNLYIKYNIFKYRGGTCITKSSSLGYKQMLIFIASGPIASLLVATISFCFLYQSELSSFFNMTFFVLFLYSFFDFLRSAIPDKASIKLYNGNITYNDAEVIRRYLKEGNYYKKYASAIKSYNDKSFEDALRQFDELPDNGYDEVMIYRFKATCYMSLKNYEKALENLDTLKNKFTFTADDYCNYALIQSKFGDYIQAIESYNKSLELNSEHEYSLNNIGYTLTILEQFEDAIPYFDKAIEINPKMAYAYNNRGLSKIKLNQVDSGLSDLKYSQELNPENSYYYKNMGIYYQDCGNFKLALQFFEKSKSFDSETHDIEIHIKEATRLMAHIKS